MKNDINFVFNDFSIVCCYYFLRLEVSRDWLKFGKFSTFAKAVEELKFLKLLGDKVLFMIDIIKLKA